MYNEIENSIHSILNIEIPDNRKITLTPLIQYVQQKLKAKEPVNLNFICTHNSRRSQFSQIWAYTAANYYGINANCFSGGVEVTAFNPRAVDSLKRSGFKIEHDESENPRYKVYISDETEPLVAFSKLFDDPVNSAEKFAAIMTCSHADENCPFIPGTEKRIAVNYNDPKEFDDTPVESEKYDERSLQIANEMFYVFSNLKTQ
jgi:arsenate reductase